MRRVTSVHELATTVKQAHEGLVPAIVVTERERTPNAASEATVIETGKLLGVPPLRIVALTPAANAIEATPTRLVPLIIASKVAPGMPKDGAIPVIVGCADCASAGVKPGSARKSD